MILIDLTVSTELKCNIDVICIVDMNFGIGRHHVLPTTELGLLGW